eukprot:CAMPEP_0170984678 /NCGR_PEP_ID=MMETSP0736-20130129/5004_1 /TAXON_ID=186038 /ORGANISM="Fragilariopsis kerguelensis, Strain L26-C5" /LENGTH=63 /DNA_ID=CAMNT_0011408417 /DNA_START=39 /DNA_END=230 /DNA_ORIENTATION=+
MTMMNSTFYTCRRVSAKKKGNGRMERLWLMTYYDGGGGGGIEQQGECQMMPAITPEALFHTAQ